MVATYVESVFVWRWQRTAASKIRDPFGGHYLEFHTLPGLNF